MHMGHLIRVWDCPICICMHGTVEQSRIYIRVLNCPKCSYKMRCFTLYTDALAIIVAVYHIDAIVQLSILNYSYSV